MPKRKEFIRGVLSKRGRRRRRKRRKEFRTQYVKSYSWKEDKTGKKKKKNRIKSECLCDPVEKIKLSSNKMKGEIKRVEFSMKYVFRGQKKKMSNKKSKARKVCQSFHTKQFVQPADL